LNYIIFLNSIYRNILDDYFSFMLQSTFATNLPCLDPFLETQNWHKTFNFVFSLIQVWLLWNCSDSAFYHGCASTNMCKYIVNNLVVIHLLTLWKPYYLSHEEQKYLVECQWKSKTNVRWVLQLASLHWSLCAFL
jgi:hypothetical protein